MQCRYCGSTTKPTDTFCKSCGARLNREVQTINAPAKQPWVVIAVFAGFIGLVLIATVPFYGTGSSRTEEVLPKSIDGSIEYEDLARAIDQGHIHDYAGKRLRIRGHIRAYGVNADEPYLVVGERLPEKQFPTMFCMMPSSQHERALEFRGSQAFEGMYNSAFPDRPVTLDVQFLGTIKEEGVPAGVDVYSAQDCRFVQ